MATTQLTRTDEIIQAVLAEIESFRPFIDQAQSNGLRAIVVEIILKDGGGRPRSVVVRPEVRRNLLSCQDDP